MTWPEAFWLAERYPDYLDPAAYWNGSDPP